MHTYSTRNPGGLGDRAWEIAQRWTGKRVALIACSAAKVREPVPARHLYTGWTFRQAVTWAEREADAWLILSAQHGAISPSRVVAPYDRTLDTREARHRYGVRLSLTLTRWCLFPSLLDGCTLIGLAPAPYLAPLEHDRRWGPFLERPLAGLGIGEQRAWFARANRTPEPTPERAGQLDLWGAP